MSRAQRINRRFLACCCLVAVTPTLRSEAPRLDYLFPAGAQRGANVVVTCHGEFDWPVDVWAEGVDVTVTEDKGKLRLEVPHDFTADRAWLRIHNQEGASALLPFVIGSLPEIEEQEPNDAPRTAQALREQAAPPGDSQLTINGRLNKKGDVDSFAVSLSRGQTLVAAVEANSAFGSPMDAILQIVKPDGTVLWENHDDVGLDPRLAFTADASGTYIVRLFAFPSAPNQRIEFHGGDEYVYRLTLTTGPYVTHAIPLSVRQEHSETVEVRGWNIPSGTRLPVSPLETRETRWELEPFEDFRYPRGVLGIVLGPAWAGGARVRCVPFPVCSSLVKTSEEQPWELAVPSAVTGCLRSRNHVDFYRLPLQQGQDIALSVESMSVDLPTVPLVQLRDPTGKVVVEHSESGAAKDVSIRYQAKTDGAYRLTVQDRYQHGGERYVYRLTVRVPVTDFQLTVDKDSFVLPSGEVLEVPVTIKRNAVSGETLGAVHVSAEDLTTGIECAPVISESKGESAGKVTLKLKSSRQQPYSGWVRIRGTEQDLDLTRWALTPPQFKVSFDRIWLTVRPPEPSKAD